MHRLCAKLNSYVLPRFLVRQASCERVEGELGVQRTGPDLETSATCPGTCHMMADGHRRHRGRRRPVRYVGLWCFFRAKTCELIFTTWMLIDSSNSSSSSRVCPATAATDQPASSPECHRVARPCSPTRTLLLLFLADLQCLDTVHEWLYYFLLARTTTDVFLFLV